MEPELPGKRSIPLPGVIVGLLVAIAGRQSMATKVRIMIAVVSNFICRFSDLFSYCKFIQEIILDILSVDRSEDSVVEKNLCDLPVKIIATSGSTGLTNKVS